MAKKFTILLLFITLPVLAQTETPNPGPRTKEEPKILYQEGNEAMDALNYGKAIQAFQRLIDRYPLDSNFIEAHLKLGEALLRAGKPAQAISPFAVYIKHHFKDELGNEARLSLTKAYLEAKKLTEARSMTEETLKHQTSALIQQQALLLKTLVLTKQKKLAEARASLDAFLQSTEQEGTRAAAELESKARFVLKTAECSNLPEPKEPKRKNEEAWMNHLQAIKNCFKESLAQSTVPQFEKLKEAELKDWCLALQSEQKDFAKKVNDRSFWPKIEEAFDSVKETAKEKSKLLLDCEVKSKKN